MSLLKSAAQVGGLTMASRCLGVVRDILTASLISTGPVAQAFVIAFRLPYLFRTLFARVHSTHRSFRCFHATSKLKAHCPQRNGGTGLCSFFAGLLGITGRPDSDAVAHACDCPGYADEPAKFDLAVALTRIAFLAPFHVNSAVLGGILEQLAAIHGCCAAPIVLNVIMIATLLTVLALGEIPVATGHALVVSMSAAGVAQFGLLALACRRANMGLMMRWPKITPEVAELVKLIIPGLIAGGITQVNILISTMIATSIDRAVSYLYYAERLYQLPLGVIGVAIGVVLLPKCHVA
jgi:putative peptidoglycan lipid II flippase